MLLSFWCECMKSLLCWSQDLFESVGGFSSFKYTCTIRYQFDHCNQIVRQNLEWKVLK
jgi:hypothetical protein